MTYARLQAGALTAHAIKGTGLVLEADSGEAVVAVRRGKEPYSAEFEAADGIWTMRGTGGSKWSGPERWVVSNAKDAEIGTLEKGGATRSMALPDGSTLWEYHATRSPQYRVDGLFSASRKAGHRLAPGFSKRPFTIEVTDALVARSDGSLLLALAAWCTNNHIDSKVDSS